MTSIKIYGAGCPNCEKFAKNTHQAADKLNLKYELQKIFDINEIMSANIITTPALAVNDKVISSGKVLSVNEIEKILKTEN